MQGKSFRLHQRAILKSAYKEFASRRFGIAIPIVEGSFLERWRKGIRGKMAFPDFSFCGFAG
jgi:hypothetical protein